MIIGIYSNPAILKLSSGEKFSKSIEKITITGNDTQYFDFSTSNFQLTQGQLTHEFAFTAKSSSSPRLYQLRFSHNETSIYSHIPPLNIKVSAEKCDIKATYSSYSIVNGGQSLPIVFDFSNCMPEIDVTMNGEAITTIEGQAITSPYVTFTENNKSITFSNESQTQISFILDGDKESGADQPEAPSATLKFTFTGTNSASFTFTQEITITVVNAISTTPQITMTPITSPTAGEQSFKVTCSQVSVIYYTLSQSLEEIEDITSYAKIKNMTLDKNIGETNIGEIYTNQFKSIYGYALSTTAGSSTEITIKEKLESAAIYYGLMMCVNENLVQSNIVRFNWTQLSNQGTPLLFRMLFMSLASNGDKIKIALTNIQRNELTCKISELTYIQTDFVLNSQGFVCNESYTEDEEITNATNSTSRLRFLSTSNYTVFDEYIVLLPDPYVAKDTSISAASAILSATEFASELFTSLSSNFNSMILSEYQCTSIDNYPVMPVISSPIATSSENSIKLTFTIQNSNGYVFSGLILKNNSNYPPTSIQVKKKRDYTFISYDSQFLLEGIPITLQFTKLSESTDYMYYWIVTNEYPDTTAFQTGLRISPENISTIGVDDEEEQSYFDSAGKISIAICFIFIYLMI